MSRPPEARVFMHHSGVLTERKNRDPETDDLALIEVNGEVVGHLPYTKLSWEFDVGHSPMLTFTTLAGKSDLSSREQKPKDD